MGSNDGRDPVEDYRIINEELSSYEYRLMERPQIVLANKMDLEPAQENLKRFKGSLSGCSKSLKLQRLLRKVGSCIISCSRFIGNNTTVPIV